jgi:hypothetical protein
MQSLYSDVRFSVHCTLMTICVIHERMWWLEGTSYQVLIFGIKGWFVIFLSNYCDKYIVLKFVVLKLWL